MRERAPAELLDLACDRSERNRTAPGDGDVPTGRRERQRRSAANAATAAGDQRKFVLTHAAFLRDRSDLIR